MSYTGPIRRHDIDHCSMKCLVCACVYTYMEVSRDVKFFRYIGIHIYTIVMYVCRYVGMYVCMYVHPGTDVHVHVDMYVCLLRDTERREAIFSVVIKSVICMPLV